jgi:3-oxoacyl-[acyl-carrier protein] reductase
LILLTYIIGGFNMDRKIAVVTGASRGIGRCIAFQLAKENYYVVANYCNNSTQAKDTLLNIKNYSDGMCIRADVSDVDAVKKMKTDIIKLFGKIDVLVNNAGSIVRPGHWREIDEEAWDRTFAINTKGAFNCIRAFAELLDKNGHGKIVNIASTVGEDGVAAVAAYSAAKAAVINITKMFAKELAPSITVNAVSPGNINTEMTQGAGPEIVKAVIEATPLKRLGEPFEVAHLVSFLCSEKASFITGQIIDIDGGFSL